MINRKALNYKALRLLEQLVVISKDQSWGLNMCVGLFPGDICWDVHVQLFQCLGTQYSLQSIDWLLRGRRGAGSSVFSRARKKKKKKKKKNILSFETNWLKPGSKQII